MGKGQKIFPIWASANSSLTEKRFLLVGNSFMLHQKVNDLSPNAFRVYMHMMLECGGAIEFTMPYRVYKKFISKPAFGRAVDELVESGFIEIAFKGFNLRKPNRYKFVTKWKEDEKRL